MFCLVCLRSFGAKEFFSPVNAYFSIMQIFAIFGSFHIWVILELWNVWNVLPENLSFINFNCYFNILLFPIFSGKNICQWIEETEVNDPLRGVDRVGYIHCSATWAATRLMPVASR